jgi:hypothetical protein
MAKPRSSTRCSCTSYVCTIPSTLAPGMRVFPIFKIATTEPYISQTTTTPFRWGWDFNHWVPWMFHYPLWSSRKTRHMIQMQLTKPASSLSRSNTSTNMFKIFYRGPIPSTINAMINIGCHTSFRWETKFGCTCRKNALQGLIGRFSHFIMGLTPLTRLWVTIIFSSTYSPSLACTQCSMWTSFNLIFHHYWIPRR